MASLRCLMYRLLFVSTYLWLRMWRVKQPQMMEEENVLE
jgi:hypothetical protein